MLAITGLFLVQLSSYVRHPELHSLRDSALVLWEKADLVSQDKAHPSASSGGTTEVSGSAIALTMEKSTGVAGSFTASCSVASILRAERAQWNRYRCIGARPCHTTAVGFQPLSLFMRHNGHDPHRPAILPCGTVDFPLLRDLCDC